MEGNERLTHGDVDVVAFRHENFNGAEHGEPFGSDAAGLVRVRIVHRAGVATLSLALTGDAGVERYSESIQHVSDCQSLLFKSHGVTAMENWSI